MDKINRIKYCPKCGTKTLEGAEFCQKCGAKLIEGASVQTAASDSANSIQMPGRVSEAVPKKKKSKAVDYSGYSICLYCDPDNSKCR